MIKKLFFALILLSSSFAKDPFLLPESEPLTHQNYTIKYASASEIAKKINKRSNHILSKIGYAIDDEKLNTVLVYDDKPHLKKIDWLIKNFDKEPKQVLIKAMITMIDKNSLYQLGTYFEESNKNTENNYQNALSTLNIPVIKFGSENSFSIKLNSLEKNGQAVVISEPKLIALNRSTAMIASGEEIPYSQKTEETSTTLFKKAVLQLQVTPIILPNDSIQLTLDIRQDKPGALLLDGVPIIRTQELKTQVIVKDKRTLALGGIYEQNTLKEHSDVPFLSRIPILGKLFQNKQNEKNQKQLLVFITPQILR